MSSSPYLYGVHEPAPKDVMPLGWILYLEEVGHSGDLYPPRNFTSQGHGAIVRIQHSWGTGGTLPQPDNLDGYIKRVVSLVRNSSGCARWIIGNEPNLAVEWPDGLPLVPYYVARVYDLCRVEIQSLSGHEHDEVLLCPVGPWNVQIGIDWIGYFQELIAHCEDIDGFALHTYSRGASPESIISEDKMDTPYDAYYNGFRTYRDWMDVIMASDYAGAPVYITETNQNDAWLDANTGWVKAAYAEIDGWNRARPDEVIRSLVLYRWPRYDKYYIEGKGGVIDDFQDAQAFGYKWTQEPQMPRRTLEIDAMLKVDGQTSGRFVGTLEEVL